MAKKSIVMPEQFYKGVQMLPSEQQGEAYNAYLEYAFYGKKYEGSNIAIAVLIASVSDSIDTANANYEKKLKNLKKKKTSTESEEAGIESKEVVTESDTDIVSDTVTVTDISPNGDKEKGDTIVSPKKKTTTPSLDEVKVYAAEQGKPEEAEHFFDYYTANGWKVGKNPMKDWKAAFRNWKRSAYNKSPTIDKDAEWEAFLARKAAEDD